jgi:hypothetical protein
MKSMVSPARDRVNDFICGHNGTGAVRDIDVESGVHLLIRIIRRRVFDHRDFVAELARGALEALGIPAAMDFKLLQSISLAVAEARRVDTILPMIVSGLVDKAGIALARIWLVGPGDICAHCRMRSECSSQDDFS